MFSKPVSPNYAPLTPSTENLRTPSEPRQPSLSGAQGWRPTWMRHFVIASFLLFFLLALAGLQGLYAISARNNGLASTDPKFYYLWTYGPTAILTLVLALWNRVHYRMRQMNPWVSMSRNRPITAEKSIFQDYLSPTAPEILWHSLRNRDWLVASSTLILALLTLSTVISTGLLSLASVPMLLDGVQYRITSKFTDEISQQVYDSSLAGNIYDAINTMDLPYPFGTTADLVYQPFELVDTSLAVGSEQQAPVEFIAMNLDCQEAELQVHNLYYSWNELCSKYSYKLPTMSRNHSVDLLSNDCELSVNLPYAYGNDQQIGNFAFFDFYKCANSTDSSGYRIFMGFGQAQQHGDVGPYSADYGCNKTSPKAQIEILRSKQWVCKPHMAVHNGNVTFNSTTFELGGQPNVTFDRNIETRTISDDILWTIHAAIYLVFQKAVYLQGKPISIDLMGIDSNDSSYGGPEVRILKLAPSATVEDLLSTDLFADLSKSFYKSALAQITRLWLTADDNTLVQGTATINVPRLIVRHTPLRVMQGLFGLMALLSLYMTASLRLKNIVPCDPAHILGIASIMKENREVRSLFTATGSYDSTVLKAMHQSSSWKTTFAPSANYQGSSFILHQSAYQDTTESGVDQLKVKWWRPLIATLLSRSLIFVLVITVVVALQILLVVSQRNQGLREVSRSGAEHLAWSLAPAAAMTIIATCFRALNSAYKVFAPYCLLQKGAVASKTLLRNFQSMTEYEVLFHAARDRQLGVFLMTISAILASFLTIIVSGVFTASSIPSPFDVSMARTSWFTTAGSKDDGSTGNSALIGGLTLEANLSYPDWTYQDLTFASFRLTDSDNQPSQTSTNTSIRVTLPAIRPALNCTLYDQKDIPNLGYYDAPKNTSGYPTFRANFPGPVECAGNLSAPVNFANSEFFGRSDYDLYFGSTANVSVADCPSLISIWGHHAIRKDNYNHITYAKALSCYEYVEQVDVDTTLTYPGLKIDTSHPPRPIESTAKLFSDAYVALPYFTMPLMDVVLSMTPRYWGAIVYGAGLNETDLGKPEMTDTVVAAIKNTHKIVRAQQYHVALRVNEADTSTPITVQATVTDWSKTRLILNPISTNLLCALLIVMLICAGISSWLMSTRHVLPKDPSSIAAMISLLADSNIFERKELWADSATSRAHFVNDSRTLFKMGWFGNGVNEDRVYTVYAVDGSSGSDGYELGCAGQDAGRAKDQGADYGNQKGTYTSVQQVGDDYHR